MNSLRPYRLLLATLLLTAGASAFATPIDFREVSLLVRARQSEKAITTEVSSRKLLHKLTPEQETKLKTQGASENLIQTLRSSTTAPDSEAESPDGPRDVAPVRHRHLEERGGDRMLSDNNVQVLDVGYERPINLSFWGGPDREFIFHHTNALDCADQKVEMLESASGYFAPPPSIHSNATGLASLQPYDNFPPRQAGGRRIGIDEKNPVRLPGVRYPLYPVYGAGGVALYYIGPVGSSSTRIAVVARR